MKLGSILRSMDFKKLWSLFLLCIRFARFVIPTIKATRKTISICDELYQKAHHRNGPENAFRHALWNALIVQRSVARKLPKSRALAWAKTFTDWHEDFSPNAPLARAMDLHNNRVGRSLADRFYDEREDFIVAQLLKMVPLSRKRTNSQQFSEDIGYLVHIEESKP